MLAWEGPDWTYFINIYKKDVSHRSYTDVYFEQVGLQHMHYIFCHGQPIHGGRPMCALGQAIVCSQGERSPPLYVITWSKCFIHVRFLLMCLLMCKYSHICSPLVLCGLFLGQVVCGYNVCQQNLLNASQVRVRVSQQLWRSKLEAMFPPLMWTLMHVQTR